MASITALKTDFQQEDFASGASVSSGAGSQLAGNVQFLNKYAVREVAFNVNGLIGSRTAPIADLDGSYAFYSKMQLVGVYAYVSTAGSSGNTTFDIVRIDSGNVQTSIFSTLPSVNFAGGNNSRLQKDFVTNTNVLLTSGSTAPILAITTFNPGDIIKMNLTAIQPGSVDCGIRLFFVPIN